MNTKIAAACFFAGAFLARFPTHMLAFAGGALCMWTAMALAGCPDCNERDERA